MVAERVTRGGSRGNADDINSDLVKFSAEERAAMLPGSVRTIDPNLAFGFIGGGTTGAGDGTHAQPVAGIAGGGQVGAGGASGSGAGDGWVRQVEIQEPHDLTQLAIMRQKYDAAVQASPGAVNDPDIIANYNYWEQKLTAQDAAGMALADANTNQLLFAGIGGQALLAGGAVIAPVAGTYFAGLGVSDTIGGIAYYGTSFAVGGTAGGAFEYSKNRVFGFQDTIGGYTGSILGGGIGGTGWQVLGRGVPVLLNNIVTGGVLGSGSDFVGQEIDMRLGNRTTLDGRSILVSGGIGAAAGGAVPLEVRVGGLNAGRNSSLSIYNGLQTRISTGNVGQFQLRYGVIGGFGQRVRGVGQGAASSAYVGIYQDANR